MTTKKTTRAVAITLASIALLLVPAAALGAPSDLDPTFGNAGITMLGGVTNDPPAIAAAPGGKIVVAGTLQSDPTQLTAVRIDRDGKFDPTFDAGNVAHTSIGGASADAQAVAVDNKGRVIVAGDAQSAGRSVIGVTRFTADGAPDTSFASGGSAVVALGQAVTPAAIAVMPDDAIVVAGDETVGTIPQQRIAVAKVSSAGQVDASFGSTTVLPDGGSALVHAIAPDGSGGFYIAGRGSSTTQGRSFVAHFDAGGHLDPTFGVRYPSLGSDPTIYGLAAEPDGRVLLAGGIGGADGAFVARMTMAGALDPTFAPGAAQPGVLRAIGTDAFRAIARAPSGNWAVAGSATRNEFLVGSVTDAGAFDAGFAPGGTATTTIGGPGIGAMPTGMAVAADGGIVVGGLAFTDSPIGVFPSKVALARWVGEGAAPSGAGGPGTTPGAGGGTPGAGGPGTTTTPPPPALPPQPRGVPLKIRAKGDRFEINGVSSLPGSARIVQYDWDFNHDHRYTASCPSSDPVGIHAFPHAGTYTVGLKVVDANGLSATRDMKVAVAHGAGGPATDRRAVAEDGFACAALGPNGADCINRIDLDGQDVRAVGRDCFVEQGPTLHDPRNQRISGGLAHTASVATSTGNGLNVDPGVLHWLTGKLYTIDGPFQVDGLQITPQPGKVGIVDERTNLLMAPGATVSIYKSGYTLARGLDIAHRWPDATSLGRELPLPAFPDVTELLPDFLGFPLVGGVKTTFVNGQLRVDATLQLPGALGDLKAGVSLTADASLGLHLNDIHASASDLPFGPVDLTDVTFDYTAADRAWRGHVCVLIAHAVAPCGEIGFRNGEFQYARGEFVADGLGVPLVPPFLSLNQVSVGVDAGPPMSLSGHVRLTAGGEIDVLGAERSVASIDGNVKVTTGDPWSLQADGQLTILGLPVANAFMRYDSNAGVTFGGDANASIGPISFDGHIRGYVYGLSDFQTDAEVHACVWICAGAEVVISSKGAGACLDLFDDWHPGAGVFWNGKVVVMGDSCDIAQFRVAPKERVAMARAASTDSAGGDSTVTIGSGLPGEVFAVTGTDAAPGAVVTGPDGTVYSSPDGQTVRNDRYVWFQAPDRKTTYVLVHHPQAGTWRVTAAPGSPAVASVQTADGIAPPKASATVTGHGRARVLRYRVAPVAGQTVTFFENGRGAARKIGVAHGATGTLRFAVAPGPGGTRTISAFVTRDGLPRARMTVATYRAPRAPAHHRAPRRRSRH